MATDKTSGPDEQRLKTIREISEGMRCINPDAYNAAEAPVKRRVSALKVAMLAARSGE